MPLIYSAVPFMIKPPSALLSAGNNYSTYLLVLIGSDGNKLGLRESKAADCFLRPPDLHDVDTGLILVEGVQHDLRDRTNTLNSGLQAQLHHLRT